MRIHLGHHFYGAGNLGDDFMLAGFLTAMQRLAPEATFTSSVPFPLEPLQRRFPQIDWRPYELDVRARCIAECDAWLGLGGSPFQSAQSRWFVDHLVADAALCRKHGKAMYYLGIGVQTIEELALSDVRALCDQAAAIWTRDADTAERLSSLDTNCRVVSAADLAHVFFESHRSPPPRRGRMTLVANFDFAEWSGRHALLEAATALHPDERIWLAQESRELPGAERALYATLSEADKSAWRLVIADPEAATLTDVLKRWPSGEWLITSRYHAAVAGAWAGSKIVVIAINEKLRGIAAELNAPSIPVDADFDTAIRALKRATIPNPPREQAEKALAACRAFVNSIASE